MAAYYEKCTTRTGTQFDTRFVDEFAKPNRNLCKLCWYFLLHINFCCPGIWGLRSAADTTWNYSHGNVHHSYSKELTMSWSRSVWLFCLDITYGQSRRDTYSIMSISDWTMCTWSDLCVHGLNMTRCIEQYKSQLQADHNLSLRSRILWSIHQTLFSRSCSHCNVSTVPMYECGSCMMMAVLMRVWFHNTEDEVYPGVVLHIHTPIVWCQNPACRLLWRQTILGDGRTPGWTWKDAHPTRSKSWMAENRPGQILNSRPLHVYTTRHRVRQLGADSLEDYENILDNLFSDNNSTMAVTPDDVAKLGKRLGAMWVRLEPFDGSQNVSDFFKDLQRYLSQTGNTTDQEKLDTLISHITGEAKALCRTLETPTFDSLKSALEEHFGLTDQEKRQLKSTFYSSKQIPGETFKQYVTRMQQLAREINVPDAEVVEVCIGGARAELRPHLTMASPASVAALLKLAVVANESLVADANPKFEALNMVTYQLQQSHGNVHHSYSKELTMSWSRSVWLFCLDITYGQSRRDTYSIMSISDWTMCTWSDLCVHGLNMTRCIEQYKSQLQADHNLSLRSRILWSIHQTSFTRSCSHCNVSTVPMYECGSCMMMAVLMGVWFHNTEDEVYPGVVLHIHTPIKSTFSAFKMASISRWRWPCGIVLET